MSNTHENLSNMQETQFTQEQLHKLAEMIFPHYQELPSLQELDEKYPPRNLPEGAIVNRVGPSPTGMMHIGGLYVALVNQRLAKQTNGIFFLRIEDTDTKRSIKEAYPTIINSLMDYGVTPDEGPVRADDGSYIERGDYGPYVQTARKAIYHACAFDMLCRGVMYPCFMSETDLEQIREEQKAADIRTGIYGEWAKSRQLSFDEIEEKLKSNTPYVLRLRAPKMDTETISWEDKIRGILSLPHNIIDTVLIKSDGIPTYHFAHLVDDHFMRTTHIIRADEWISSVPLHLQLFSLMNWPPPQYTHVSAIQKLSETGGKRKLSKRHDPEADVQYYWERGFPRQAVIEYLLNLANSDFEDWRRANPTADYKEFTVALEKMGQAGALADLVKLESISREILAKMDVNELYKLAFYWASAYDAELAEEMAKDPEYTCLALNVERGGEKGANRLATFLDLRAQLAPFYDRFLPEVSQLPFATNVSLEDRKQILSLIKETYKIDFSSEQSFENIKKIATDLGFAAAVKDYKKNPTAYKGHVGDVAGVIRVAMFGSSRSPELGWLMRVLGKETLAARCDRVINS